MFENLPESSMAQMHPLLVIGASICAALSVIILLWFLIRRPPIDWGTRLALLAGFGIFPLGTALLGNIVSLQHTQKRGFCGSCHVMTPYSDDSSNPESNTLAAQHARNAYFGEDNCYNCHQDYRMFGVVYTKIGGLRHVYEYYTEYKDYSLEEAKDKIHLYEPFTNRNCTTCHSMQAKGWREKTDHKQLLDELGRSEVSCVSSGCHGPAHPFSKPPAPADGAEAPAPEHPAAEGGQDHE